MHDQSSDIAQGVDKKNAKEMGAGDQGIMFGYACSDTDAYMPAPLYWSHRILQALDEVRCDHYQLTFGPDAKTQITFNYENSVPIGIKTIVLSTQHHIETTLDEINAIVIPMIHKTLPEKFINTETEILINPTGRFVIGGPDGDCGLTGRKIIVIPTAGQRHTGAARFQEKTQQKLIDRLRIWPGI